MGVFDFLLGCLVTALVLRRRPAATKAALKAMEAATKGALDAAASADAARAALGAPAPVPLLKPAPRPRAAAKPKPAAAKVAKPIAKKAPAKPKPASRPVPADRVPVGAVLLPPAAARAALLASFHSAVLQLEERRLATEPVPAPVDRVPLAAAPVADDDGLLRLPTPSGPRDIGRPVPESDRGEPFLYVGRQDGEETEEEMAIEWPEPGAIAVAEVAKRGDGYFMVNPMTRTRTRVETHSRLADGWGDQQDRGLLTPDMTHLRVAGKGGPREWSVRLIGPSDLDELEQERQGTGDVFLAVRDAAPVELVAHIKSAHWSVKFVCGCWAGDKCACPKPDHYQSPTISSSGEALKVLAVPRPGLLLLEVYQATDPWRLRLRAVGSERDED
ncbi:hypothetical protein P3T37_003426 [Kitasatospora sp. MAA4]|uniref:hypothetical protein n=1 Tax=Kitasatospora sp. MAA4 TaxID=3035093 RepID=UPI0024754A62|nr:hypothetical protein [Kitasatospora sp. MAA4]MDH6134027.1 hypothetical protein [Kitasatospora sp. MAA4]